MNTWPKFDPAGDSALRVAFGDEIDPEVNRRVHALAQLIQDDPIPGIGEAVPGYSVLLVHYDPLVIEVEQVENWLRQRAERVVVRLVRQPRRVEIPVYYGGEHGPDLKYVAEANDLRVEDVIRIHSSNEYPVYMMGFTPGFPYLGGMDPAIATPRLSTPRSLVPGGSVGIAGEQTGIYPVDSPGGWRIIGWTPLRLFDSRREPPFLFAPGDVVRFVPISADGKNER